jgi:hypothetical protein
LLLAAPALLRAAGHDLAASRWLQEDGGYESAGALCCWFGGLVLLAAWWAFPREVRLGPWTLKRNPWRLAFGLLLLLIFAEEIPCAAATSPAVPSAGA